MAKLGEAYVRIRADLEPFAKDLDHGLKQITDKFEKNLNRSLGMRIGRDVGTGARDGLKEAVKNIGDDFTARLSVPANNKRVGRKAGQDFGDGYGEGLSGTIKRVSGLFITALEDGFSSLPPQVKGVVGAALVAALVPAGAFAGAALATAVIGGVAGIGIALASQFEEVESEFLYFAGRLRVRAVEAARPFAGEIIASLDLFETELDRLDPKLRNVFGNAAAYVQPFARGLTSALDGVLSGLEEGLAGAEFDQLSHAIEMGLGDLGKAVGDVFADVLTNPDLDEALSDLLATATAFVDVGGSILDWTTTAWHDFKTVAGAVGDTAEAMFSFAKLLDEVTSTDPDWVGRFGKAWDEFVYDFIGGSSGVQKSFGWMAQANRAWNNETEATIKATKEQIKAQEELNGLLDRQQKLINDVIGAQIDYQEAIDRTVADFKEYGTSLKLADEDGRRNAENIQRQINLLNEQLTKRVEAGEITNAEAQKFHDKEIARLRAEFKARGGNLEQFDELFGRLLALQRAEVVPNKLGPFAAALQPIIAALREIQSRTNSIREQGLPSTYNKSGVGPGQQKYADGGFITEPTNAIMGENYKEEVVLPLTNTRRSMQLLARSSLAGLLGNTPNVNVFIGDEQLDSRMFKVAKASNRAVARSVSQTPRMV